jgi:carbamoyl-phosphate synthase small subunit
MNSVILLEDGKYFFGNSFGYSAKNSNDKNYTIGEVVFNTASTGYQETLTDPSYYNQIVVETTAHVGNTGINFTDNESRKVWVKGFVVRELSEIPSNWQSKKSLDTYLKQQKVMGISDVDTRALTIYIRNKGVMRGGIFQLDDSKSFNNKKQELLKYIKKSPKMKGQNLSNYVTTEHTKTVGHGKTIVALDLGVKQNSINILKNSGAKVVTLSANNLTVTDILKYKPNGVFYSNGPGDPASAILEVSILK